MEKHYALIKNGIVEGIIVADDSFLQHVEKKYDLILDVTDKRPNVGDSYYPDTKSFISNDNDVNSISADLSAAHMSGGTKDSFEPLRLTKYPATYSNGMVAIGCKQYSAAGLFDALHKVLVEKQNTTSIFTSAADGPTHGKFGITWDDAQRLYDALKEVKFR